MIEISGRLFLTVSNLLRHGQRDMQKGILDRGAAFPLLPEEEEWVETLFSNAALHCKMFGLVRSAERAADDVKNVKDFTHSYQLAETELGKIADLIATELDERKFVFVEPKYQAYFEHKALFGDQVNAVFSDAIDDIRDAGNSLAVGLYTAAVFHLMRVAERGLVRLARHAKVRIKKTPLEWAEWRPIIAAIQKKVEAIAQKPRGPKRDKLLEFYRGAIGELEAFKDVYRNPVMHARVRYDDLQAESVMRHVREFMSRLAKEVG